MTLSLLISLAVTLTVGASALNYVGSEPIRSDGDSSGTNWVCTVDNTAYPDYSYVLTLNGVSLDLQFGTALSLPPATMVVLAGENHAAVATNDTQCVLYGQGTIGFTGSGKLHLQAAEGSMAIAFQGPISLSAPQDIVSPASAFTPAVISPGSSYYIILGQDGAAPCSDVTISAASDEGSDSTPSYQIVVSVTASDGSPLPGSSDAQVSVFNSGAGWNVLSAGVPSTTLQTGAAQVTLSGTADAGSSPISVYQGGELIDTAFPDSTGSWTLPVDLTGDAVLQVRMPSLRPQNTLLNLDSPAQQFYNQQHIRYSEQQRRLQKLNLLDSADESTPTRGQLFLLAADSPEAGGLISSNAAGDMVLHTPIRLANVNPQEKMIQLDANQLILSGEDASALAALQPKDGPLFPFTKLREESSSSPFYASSQLGRNAAGTPMISVTLLASGGSAVDSVLQAAQVATATVPLSDNVLSTLSAAAETADTVSMTLAVQPSTLTLTPAPEPSVTPTPASDSIAVAISIEIPSALTGGSSLEGQPSATPLSIVSAEQILFTGTGNATNGSAASIVSSSSSATSSEPTPIRSGSYTPVTVDMVSNDVLRIFADSNSLPVRIFRGRCAAR